MNNRKIFGKLSVVLALLLLVSLAVPALAAEPQLDFITDQAGILTDEQWVDLETRAASISDTYGCGVFAVILDNYADYADSPRECAKWIRQEYDLGAATDDNVILLLLSMEDRQYWLLAHGDFGNYALTDYGREVLSSQFLPYFGDDDWYGGFSAYLDHSEFILGQAADGTPVDVGSSEEKNSPVKSYGIALAVSAAIALIVCGVFTRQMNSARKQDTAAEYITPGGVDITNRRDHYTHTTTQRTKIRSDSDSGSGGTTVDSDGDSGSGGSF